jgi:hypothetical protein
MVYHDRPALTKMSIDDMVCAMQFLRNEGHTVQALVIGDSYNIASFCHEVGVRHEMFANKPIADKFSYAWLRAVQAHCDYIAWWGSNNVHSAGYLAECNEVLWGKRVATFGTNNCVIVSADTQKETCVFRPRDHYLISSGQFFLTHSIQNSVNPLTVYDREQTFNFDGKILDAMTDKWGKDIIELVTHDEEDCLDIKNSVNIHSYQSYMNRSHYPRYESKDVLRHRHPSFDLYLRGVFN